MLAPHVSGLIVKNKRLGKYNIACFNDGSVEERFGLLDKAGPQFRGGAYASW